MCTVDGKVALHAYDERAPATLDTATTPAKTQSSRIKKATTPEWILFIYALEGCAKGGKVGKRCTRSNSALIDDESRLHRWIPGDRFGLVGWGLMPMKVHIRHPEQLEQCNCTTTT